MAEDEIHRYRQRHEDTERVRAMMPELELALLTALAEHQEADPTDFEGSIKRSVAAKKAALQREAELDSFARAEGNAGAADGGASGESEPCELTAEDGPTDVSDEGYAAAIQRSNAKVESWVQVDRITLDTYAEAVRHYLDHNCDSAVDTLLIMAMGMIHDFMVLGARKGWYEEDES